MTNIETLRKGDCTEFRVFRDPEKLLIYQKDDHGNYFIDRDGQLFRYVLNYLRTSTTYLPAEIKERKALIVEAEYYGCQDLKQALYH